MTNELNHTLSTASKYNMYDIKSNLSGFKCNHSNVALSDIFCLKYSGKKKLTKKKTKSGEGYIISAIQNVSQSDKGCIPVIMVMGIYTLS